MGTFRALKTTVSGLTLDAKNSKYFRGDANANVIANNYLYTG